MAYFATILKALYGTRYPFILFLIALLCISNECGFCSTLGGTLVGKQIDEDYYPDGVDKL